MGLMSPDPGGWSRTAPRVMLASAAGFVAVLATLAYTCTDNEGSSWVRCRSFLGNPIGDPLIDTPYGNWWPFVPFVFGICISGLVWWLLQRSRRVARTTAVGVVIVAAVAAVQFAIAHFGS